MPETPSGTVFLSHYNTNYDDVIKSRTWTEYGTPSVSATQYKFGSKSFYANGSSGIISSIDSDDFNFGNNDFAVMFWTYCTTAKPQNGLIVLSHGGGDVPIRIRGDNGSGDNGYLKIDFYGYTGQPSLYSTIALPVNQWVHIAVIRYSNNAYIYINGTQRGTRVLNTAMGTGSNGIADRVIVGGHNIPMDSFYTGYIDELIIVKGSAVYTENFTPPTSPYFIIKSINSIYLGTTPITSVYRGTNLITNENILGG